MDVVVRAGRQTSRRAGYVEEERVAQYAVTTKVAHRLVSRMPWLDTVAEKMHAAFEPLLGQDKPRAVRDALYGVWLGHPLHPAVVLVPTGMWAASLALDAI